MNTRIFVMAHKAFTPPADPMYVPLHVGRAFSPDLGYMGDDTGDNISEMNRAFAELTGMYWVWKNYDGPEKYIGINHYRRYFINDNKEFLSDEEITDIMHQYDMIASERIPSEINYHDTYAQAHNVQDLEIMEDSIERLYPEYLKTFRKALTMTGLYSGNLSVMKRADYDAYCQWLFDIMFDTTNYVDSTAYSLYEKKVQGLLAEGLLSVWAMHHHLRVYEAPIGYTDEKAETKELRLAVGQLLSLGQFEEAEKLFNEVMTLRPDISLPISDIRGEIPVIQQILYIGNQERARQMQGFFGQTTKLSELIALYDSFYEALQLLGGGEDLNRFRGKEKRLFQTSDEAKGFLAEHGFTDIALEVMLHYDLYSRYRCQPLNGDMIKTAIGQ